MTTDIHSVGVRAMLEYHLHYNLFPPVIGAEGFALTCIDAIREEDPDRIVTCDGFIGRAGDVFESWHLAFWLEVEQEAAECGPCMWFAGCTREATTAVEHPILGPVPCCARCAAFARGDHDESPVRRAS